MQCTIPSLHWYFDISGKSKTIKHHSIISEINLIYYLQSVCGNKVQENKYLSKSKQFPIWLPFDINNESEINIYWKYQPIKLGIKYERNQWNKFSH